MVYRAVKRGTGTVETTGRHRETLTEQGCEGRRQGGEHHKWERGV